MRLAIWDDFQHAATGHAALQDLPDGVELTVFDEPVRDRSQVIQRLLPFDAIATMRERTRFDRTILEQLPNLQLLINASTSAPGIDVDAATDLGIVVSGTPFHGPGPAQLTWALILGQAWNLTTEDAAVREGRWGVRMATNLNGRTLGILGLGKIGTEVATVARAIGMNVIAWSHNLTVDQAAERRAQWVSKDDLFRHSDVLSIHVKLSERTAGLVGATEIAQMKPDAILVNTARGAIVDESALIDALQRRTIGGAALDVFSQEPLPHDHPLLGLPNTLLTPHIGYVTTDRFDLYFRGVVDAVVAHLADRPIAVLNPDVLTG